MYREPGERPEEPKAPARAAERYPVSRATTFMPLVGVACVIASATAYGVGGRDVALWTSLGAGALFFVALTQVLRPRFVEVDLVARRVRISPHDLSFGLVSHATKNVVGFGESRLVIHTNTQPIAIGKGVSAEVDAAARGINLALAAEYASVGEMPKELASEIRKLDTGFPLAKLLSLPEKEQAKRIAEFLRELPIEGVTLHSLRDGVIRVSAQSRGVDVTFQYGIRKDRMEIIAPRVKSPHGHLELVRNEGQRLGTGWVKLSDDVLINGAKNRVAFETVPKKDAIASKVAELRVRLHIVPEETRVVVRDGLRGLRDPKANLVSILALIGEIASALRT